MWPYLELKGVTLAAMGQLSEATCVFIKGLDIAPHRPGLWKGKGQTELRLGYYRDALDCFNKVLELVPEDEGAAKEKQKVFACA